MSDRPVDRRTMLVEPARLAAGLALAGVAGSALAGVGEGDAARLAAVLTGKADVPPALVRGAFDALAAADPLFEAHARTLLDRLDAARIADVAAFRASPLARDADLMATALAIVSALYLGRVGTGPDARLIGYQPALMFGPTADETFVPTYARGEPGWWAKGKP